MVTTNATAAATKATNGATMERKVRPTRKMMATTVEQLQPWQVRRYQSRLLRPGRHRARHPHDMVFRTFQALNNVSLRRFLLAGKAGDRVHEEIRDHPRVRLPRDAPAMRSELDNGRAPSNGHAGLGPWLRAIPSSTDSAWT